MELPFMKLIKSLLLGCALGASSVVYAADALPVVTLETTKGNIDIELYPDKAPQTVANFLGYVKAGHYDGTIFHRVIPDFMIQGGGYTADMSEKDTNAPIQNEADNGLKNARGTLAMARTGDPHSATAQFFINVKDNDFLDFRSKDQMGWGYAVFGKVVGGMEAVDAIVGAPTTNFGPMSDVPVDTILIKSAKLK
jgi:cyclophilin family peptidyl-prolyl cis-trans isomerase